MVSTIDDVVSGTPCEPLWGFRGDVTILETIETGGTMSSGRELHAAGPQKGRRHALIDEAKAEHDVAFDEMRRAQESLVNLVQDYEVRVSDAARQGCAALVVELREEFAARQRRLMLDDLFEIEATTMERLVVVSRAFGATVTMAGDLNEIDRLRAVIFRGGLADSGGAAGDAVLRAFAKGVWDYWLGIDPAGSDSRIRKAWGDIESRLRALGRKI